MQNVQTRCCASGNTQHTFNHPQGHYTLQWRVVIQCQVFGSLLYLFVCMCVGQRASYFANRYFEQLAAKQRVLVCRAAEIRSHGLSIFLLNLNALSPVCASLQDFTGFNAEISIKPLSIFDHFSISHNIMD